VEARWKLAGVFALTLTTTAVSVGFNFLGRDFFNSIAEKNPEEFQRLLSTYFLAIAGGIPIFVLRDFYKQRLALSWRKWMTGDFVGQYFDERAFYRIQSGGLVDNPDQRINDDITAFTATALGFTLVIFNSLIDLVSFSGILYSIYPPLFVFLLVYAVGGTWLTVKIGSVQVGLNFEQETREANFRYSLMRIRENAESIAFYGGESNEKRILLERFSSALDNLGNLIVATRNLDFFTSGYKYLITFLPAAFVAPLYFKGEIEFGVINQSASAFNHILGDVSLIVFQFESLAGFSATIERLVQFQDVLTTNKNESAVMGEQACADRKDASVSKDPSRSFIELDEYPEPSLDLGDGSVEMLPLLNVQELTLQTPNRMNTLVERLDVTVDAGDSLLIVGPSGTGKTSLLRALAGLWRTGSGSVQRVGNSLDEAGAPAPSSVFFVPQRPYMVLGSLREQLLYPTWTECMLEDDTLCTPLPSDATLAAVLEEVRLSKLLDMEGGLNSAVDWSSTLSLGEQQRLAFARLLLAKPQLALLDESTSALDTDNEKHLYSLMKAAGITFVSVGHRPSLVQFHKRVLRLNVIDGDGLGEANGLKWDVVPADQHVLMN